MSLKNMQSYLQERKKMLEERHAVKCHLIEEANRRFGMYTQTEKERNDLAYINGALQEVIEHIAECEELIRTKAK